MEDLRVERAPRVDVERGASETTGHSDGHASVERQLCRIWEEVLGLERVDVHDNYFELGGTSAQIVDVVARAWKIGLRLEPIDLLDSPTVAELAAAAGRPDETATVEVPAGGQIRPSFMQEGRLRREWRARAAGRSPGDFQMAIVLNLSDAEPIRPEAVRAAVEGLVCRHHAFRTRFLSVDGEPRLVVLDHTPVALTVREVQGALPATVAPDGGGDDELIVRCQLFLPAEGDRRHAVLALALSHLVCDRRSINVLAADLAALHDHALGRGPLPPEPGLQPEEWSSLERSRATPERRREIFDYWTDHLADTGVYPELRMRRASWWPEPEPDVTSFVVDADTGDGLRELARSARTTLFGVLLAAFHATWWIVSGDVRMVIHCPMINRPSPLLDSTVGWFVVPLLFGSRIEPDDTVERYLASTHRTILAGLRHAELRSFAMFSDLLERFGQEDTAPRLWLDYEPAPAAAREGSSLRVRPLEDEAMGPRSGLSLYVREDGRRIRVRTRGGLASEPSADATLNAFYRAMLETIGGASPTTMRALAAGVRARLEG